MYENLLRHDISQNKGFHTWCILVMHFEHAVHQFLNSVVFVKFGRKRRKEIVSVNTLPEVKNFFTFISFTPNVKCSYLIWQIRPKLPSIPMHFISVVFRVVFGRVSKPVPNSYDFLVALCVSKSATILICIACVCMWNACVEKLDTPPLKNFWLQIWHDQKKLSPGPPPPHLRKWSPECKIKGKIFDPKFGMTKKKKLGPKPPPPPHTHLQK